jgi:hypothetical protein
MPKPISKDYQVLCFVWASCVHAECRTYRRQEPPARWRHCCIGHIAALPTERKEVAAAVAVDGPWPHIERIYANVLRGVMALDAITTLTLRLIYAMGPGSRLGQGPLPIPRFVELPYCA